MFRGFANILQLANELAARAGDDGVKPVEVERAASAGIPGVVSVAYGASLRIGARVAPPRRRPAQEPLVDLFDEGDHIVVIVELPGVEAGAIVWNVTGGSRLLIRAESPDRKYTKEIVLPALVSDQAATSCYANGILELRLWKV